MQNPGTPLDRSRVNRRIGLVVGAFGVLITNAPGEQFGRWFPETFDRVLLDAPCSATGVIRRHPEIKWLRRPRQVDTVVKLQSELLDALWPLLAPGGRLLYVTCSLLPVENAQQIDAFVARHADGLDHRLKFLVLKRCHTHALADMLDHGAVPVG